MIRITTDKYLRHNMRIRMMMIRIMMIIEKNLSTFETTATLVKGILAALTASRGFRTLL